MKLRTMIGGRKMKRILCDKKIPRVTYLDFLLKVSTRLVTQDHVCRTSALYNAIVDYSPSWFSVSLLLLLLEH